MGSSCTFSEPPLPVNRSMDIKEISEAIEQLHSRICVEKMRVELTRTGCDDVVVLVSKKELESLEQALQILADTDSFREMAKQIHSVVAKLNETQVLPA